MSSDNVPPVQPIATTAHTSSDAAPPTPLVVHPTVVNRERHPDLDLIQHATLKEGPRVKKEAAHIVIIDRHTGEVHHDQVTIKTYRKRQGGWHEDPEHSITLSGEGDDEIQKLLDFLSVARSGSTPTESDYVIVTAPKEGIDPQGLQKLLSQLSDTNKADVLADVLAFAAHDATLFQVLLERVEKEPQLFADAAAALNLATYRQAVDQLKSLINSDQRVREAQFQELLTEHPWMFGSEYSELLDRRKWTRDEQHDFVVRRTTDNYIELIEIKTPLEDTPLFLYDRSHDSYYPGAELSKVVGQVQKYIEKLDNDRNAILANDREDTCKIRAKVIIGRDGDIHQRQALRRFNGHLHRIEVLTFDQLLKIAENVLNYLQSVIKPPAPPK